MPHRGPMPPPPLRILARARNQSPFGPAAAPTSAAAAPTRPALTAALYTPRCGGGRAAAAAQARGPAPPPPPRQCARHRAPRRRRPRPAPPGPTWPSTQPSPAPRRPPLPRPWLYLTPAAAARRISVRPADAPPCGPQLLSSHSPMAGAPPPPCGTQLHTVCKTTTNHHHRRPSRLQPGRVRAGPRCQGRVRAGPRCQGRVRAGPRCQGRVRAGPVPTQLASPGPPLPLPLPPPGSTAQGCRPAVCALTPLTHAPGARATAMQEIAQTQASTRRRAMSNPRPGSVGPAPRRAGGRQGPPARVGRGRAARKGASRGAGA
jgi:hypothetical protein